ncbi:MAG: helix-turn-helix domain-containing protein [Dehalococcoidia bacterium]
MSAAKQGAAGVRNLGPLLSVQDVAVLSGLSEKAIRSAIHDGELRAALLRGRYRISPADLGMWFECNLVERASPLTPASPPRPEEVSSNRGLRRLQSAAKRRDGAG